jgi:cell division protein FtsQ
VRRGRRNRRILYAQGYVPEAGGGALTGRPSRAPAVLPYVCMALVAVGVVAVFFVGGRALSRWLRTSDSFSVRRIDVKGAERLTHEKVLSAAGIEPGMSIFSLDEQEAREGLERHPWIREVTVEKRMPDSVSIEIVEREHVVLLWSGALYRVDSDGTIFERHPVGEAMDRVIITGVDEAWMEGDREYARSELRKVIQVLSEYKRMGLGTLAPVRTVHREHGGGIILYIGEEAREVRLGVGHTLKKLQRLRAVLRELRHEKLEWDYIMVDSRNFPERVVVKLN